MEKHFLSPAQIKIKPEVYSSTNSQYFLVNKYQLASFSQISQGLPMLLASNLNITARLSEVVRKGGRIVVTEPNSPEWS